MNSITPLQGKTINRQAQETNFIIASTILMIIVAGVFVFLQNNTDQLVLITPLLATCLASFWFSRKGKYTVAGWTMIYGVALQFILSTIIFTELVYSSVIGSLIIIGSISLSIFPRKSLWQGLIVSITTAVLVAIIDSTGSINRPPPPTSNLIFRITLIVLYVYFAVRQFPTFALRTKIILGIVVTSGISLIISSTFIFFRSNTIAENLSKDLGESEKQNIKNSLIAISEKNSAEINNQLESISTDINQLASYRSEIEKKASILNSDLYWDARTNLIQLSGGQYSSLPSDSASVFIPSTVLLTDAIIADLNTTARIDVNAYGVLKKYSSAIAVYYLTTSGITTYYPNIGIANVVPADFDITTQNFFTVATPENNPEKIYRWTNPYQDPAGNGLVVTVSSPVYINNRFTGVMAADLKLKEIGNAIDNIQVGTTGYSILIDKKSHIIHMPAQAYEMLSMRPEILASGEETKASILGKGPIPFQIAISKAMSGETNISKVIINNIDTYVVYSPIKNIGYSLVTLVPVSELNIAEERSRERKNIETSSTLTYSAIILATLFLVAILTSLGVGNVISAPIKELTQTSEQIAAGDLNVRAVYETDDELGRLANAFNNMTEQIKDLLAGLEQRVADRSAELVIALEKNQRRASQFEAISKAVESISSTRKIEELLPAITNVISEQFGFYHVGIFLVNENQEFAILSASNSAGGKRMLERKHKLKIGVLGIVGSVASTKKPLIALDTGANATYFNNPDLPETRSEMALPLLATTEIIGVLDIQSRTSNAFGLEDIEVLNTLASQVSIAIVNARLYEQTERTLKEADALSTEAIHRGWSRYTNSQKIFGVRHSTTKTTILHEKISPSELNNSITNSPLKADATESRMTIPIKLRGEVIGVLTIQSITERKWTDDELEMASSIVERAAITLENARLLFDSQKRADKERIIGEITSKIGSFISKDNILQSTAAEIGRILPGSEVVVQFRKNENSNE